MKIYIFWKCYKFYNCSNCNCMISQYSIFFTFLLIGFLISCFFFDFMIFDFAIFDFFIFERFYFEVFGFEMFIGNISIVYSVPNRYTPNRYVLRCSGRFGGRHCKFNFSKLTYKFHKTFYMYISDD